MTLLVVPRRTWQELCSLVFASGRHVTAQLACCWCALESLPARSALHTSPMQPPWQACSPLQSVLDPAYWTLSTAGRPRLGWPPAAGCSPRCQYLHAPCPPHGCFRTEQEMPTPAVYTYMLVKDSSDLMGAVLMEACWCAGARTQRMFMTAGLARSA